MSPASSEESGVVVRVDAHSVLVDSLGGLVRCVRRGKLFERGAGTKTPIVVGDQVRIQRSSASEGSVEKVLPRRSLLSRPAAHRPEIEHVLAANIDQIMLVCATRSPEPRTGLIDRLWIVARRSGMPLIVCLNKVDLVGREAAEDRFRGYVELQLPVIFCSAETGEGEDDLRAALLGKTTVLTGHSGVGKTSLLNRICPGFRNRVAAVNQATGKGRHTTTAAILVSVPGVGCIVDTPGLREFGLWDITPGALGAHFSEFESLSPKCRFRDCRHGQEPGCAVKSGVEEGIVQRARYESYRRILESLEAGEG